MRLFRASLAVAGAAAVALGAPAGARERPVPVPADAHRVAVRIASWGPRPAGSDGEARAQRLLARVFRGAGLRVGTQEFRVPHHGRSGNVIGVFDTPRSCLRIVMAPADTGPAGPGANDNASGLGVVAALAGRLELVKQRARRGHIAVPVSRVPRDPRLQRRAVRRSLV